MDSVLRKPVGRRGFLLGAASGLAGLSVFGRARAASGELDLSDFDVTFDEPFTKLDISPHGPGTRWIAHTPWNGDFGEAQFSDPGPDGPFSIGHDGLEITARKISKGKWRSGLICSVDRDGPGQHGFTQQFGYFEISAKLPAGTGVWPSFWLIGADKTTSAAEIDVFEYYGVGPGYFHNVMHLFVKGKDLLAKDNMASVPAGSLSTDFNTYGVLIESDETVFYFNRAEIWRQPTPKEFHQPMYLLADLALGGGWPIDNTPSPSVLNIRYIKVFQRRSADAKAPPKAD